MGRRQYPCGPHYNKKQEVIVNQVRFSPHKGLYEKMCPTCGEKWIVIINEGSQEGVLYAKWYRTDDPQLSQISVEADGSKLCDLYILVDGEGPDRLPDKYDTRPDRKTMIEVERR